MSKSTLLRQRTTEIMRPRQDMVTVTTHLCRPQQTSTNWVTNWPLLHNNLSPSAGNTGQWTHAFISYHDQYLQIAPTQTTLDHLTFTSNKNFTHNPWNPATWFLTMTNNLIRQPRGHRSASSLRVEVDSPFPLIISLYWITIVFWSTHTLQMASGAQIGDVKVST